jgi:hypothetical protein
VARLTCAQSPRRRLVMRLKNFVDRLQSEVTVVETDQLVLNSACTQIASVPKRQDPGFFAADDLSPRRGCGVAALAGELCFTQVTGVLPPLPQRGT